MVQIWLLSTFSRFRIWEIIVVIFISVFTVQNLSAPWGFFFTTGVPKENSHRALRKTMFK